MNRNYNIKSLLSPDEVSEKDNSNNIYFNLSLKNKSYNSSKDILCNINQKTGLIMENQSEYNVAIEYFSLKTRLPVMIMPILENNNPNINDSIFGVCYVYTTNNYPQRVIYASENSTDVFGSLPSPPSKNNGKQDVSNSYYHIFQIDHFIKLVNSALLQSYNAFNTAHAGIHSSPIKLFYDPNTNLISIVAEYSYRYQNTNRANVFINTKLRNYIDNFNGASVLIDDPNFRDFYFIFEHDTMMNKNGVSIPPTAISNPPTHIEIKQQNVCLNLLHNIKFLVIKSNSMSVKNEYLPPPYLLNNIDSSSANNIVHPLPVLTFHELIYESNTSRTETLYYNPSFLKFINLIGTTYLDEVDLSVDLLTSNGETTPLFISSQGSFDIKLVFKKNR